MSEPAPLEFTGERFTPECPREIFYEHWHRYALAATAVDDLMVLDAACGEGYGSDMMARSARSVDAVDLDAATVDHARRRYGSDSLRFHQSDCLELPFEDQRFDAVVSFETLEHLGEHEALLDEFRRVLKPGGWLMISSPDKKTYSDETGYDNPYHVRELYRDELEALLGGRFAHFRLLAQKLAFVSLIWDMESAGSVGCLQTGPGGTGPTPVPAWPPLYYVAVCADRSESLPELPGLSLFGDRDESVYQHYNDEIRRNIHARGTLEAYEKRIAELEARLSRPWWKRLLG